MNKQQKLIEENALKFGIYFDALTEWNEKINLTAITEKEEVFVKHFEDSLYGEQYIARGSSLCDVGTGAGFPGVPLKIARNDIRLTLMDSLNKRITFLLGLTARLGVGAECVHTRAEDAARGKYRESFDVVTARAVARLNTLAEYCLPLVKVGGVFLAYKTADADELKEGARALKILGGQVEKTDVFTLSNGDSRSIIVIRKVSVTPAKYPRGKGKERSAPIV